MLLKFLFSAPSYSIFPVIDLCKIVSSPPLTRFLLYNRTATMSITNMQSHAFAGNSLRYKSPNSEDPFSPNSALANLKSLLSDTTLVQYCPNFRVLPFRKGSPLVTTIDSAEDSTPVWNLGWLSFFDYKGFVTDSGVNLGVESFVYLGSRAVDNMVYWAIDVSDSSNLIAELSSKHSSFVELRTLMVATDWADDKAMVDLAIAGHGRALLQWHNSSNFCAKCGEKTVPIEAGKRQQCTNESCKKSVYPRVDPVVIMLVIDRENDRALLSRQSRFVPRMWSCLAGFLEPGESLEEAVRRETWEETGIEVGDVIYHSSQPWPVGPNSMPCQLMVGFFAYAKSLQITVDKEELEDAQWHSREDVKNAVAIAEYRKAQRTAAVKVEQMCRGVEREQSLSGDFNVESGEMAPMFIPGPFAIAHHLISSWATKGPIPGFGINSVSASNSSL